MHLLLDCLYILIADAVRLIGSAVDDLTYLIHVVLIVMALLPDRCKDLVHLLHQHLLAGNASHRALFLAGGGGGPFGFNGLLVFRN